MRKTLLPGRYYLWRMSKNKKMTPIRVASKMGLSVEEVETAYEKYTNERDPFRKISFENRNSLIDIAVSIVSTLLVLFTLFEMQADRNAAYMPDISFGETKAAITWKGKESLDAENSEGSENMYDTALSSLLGEDVKYNSPITQLKIYNIGVGTAKNIQIQWNMDRNINAYTKLFELCDDINITYNGNMVYIKTSDMDLGSGIPSKDKIDFLLNATQEYKEITLPIPYNILIKLAYMRTDSQKIPPIVVSVSYSDIQGEKYQKEFKIKPQVEYMVQRLDGSGECVYILSANSEG